MNYRKLIYTIGMVGIFLLAHGGRKHPQQEFLQVDTTDILFVCGGAFSGLEKIISARGRAAEPTKPLAQLGGPFCPPGLQVAVSPSAAKVSASCSPSAISTVDPAGAFNSSGRR